MKIICTREEYKNIQFEITDNAVKDQIERICGNCATWHGDAKHIEGWCVRNGVHTGFNQRCESYCTQKELDEFWEQATRGEEC